jgi:hypothetical protein
MPIPISLNKPCALCSHEVKLPLAYAYRQPERVEPVATLPGKRIRTRKEYFHVKGAWIKTIGLALNDIIKNIHQKNSGDVVLLDLLSEQAKVCAAKKVAPDDKLGAFLNHNVQLRLLNHQWQQPIKAGFFSRKKSNDTYNTDNDHKHPFDILLFPCGTLCHQSCANKQKQRLGRLAPNLSLNWIDENKIKKIYCDCGLCRRFSFDTMRFALLIIANSSATVMPGQIPLPGPTVYAPVGIAHPGAHYAALDQTAPGAASPSPQGEVYTALNRPANRPPEYAVLTGPTAGEGAQASADSDQLHVRQYTSLNVSGERPSLPPQTDALSTQYAALNRGVPAGTYSPITPTYGAGTPPPRNPTTYSALNHQVPGAAAAFSEHRNPRSIRAPGAPAFTQPKEGLPE